MEGVLPASSLVKTGLSYLVDALFILILSALYAVVVVSFTIAAVDLLDAIG